MLDQKWLSILKASDYDTIASFLSAKRESNVIYPPQEALLRALELTPFEQVKVVIIGQDPYFRPGQAMGLAFSVPYPTPLPPTLKNILKEYQRDLDCSFTQGDLTCWARAGVLLLNQYLSVEEGRPLSHAKLGWDKVTDNIIQALSADPRPKVFLLWGNQAQKKSGLIAAGHLVLTASHPSPLSCRHSFGGCAHFSLSEKYLTEKGIVFRWPRSNSDN